MQGRLTAMISNLEISRDLEEFLNYSLVLMVYSEMQRGPTYPVLRNYLRSQTEKKAYG